MAVTIAFQMPDGAEAVISVLAIVAFLCGISKFFLPSTPKTSHPVCDRFTDSLPPLGHRAFKASELVPRREQEVLKQEIDGIERNRQAAFIEIGKIYARRVQIDKTLDDLVDTLKKQFPQDTEPAISIKRKIRDSSKEMEKCYGMADDLCYQMHQMMVQRLSLRRKIDRIDMQMESARLAEIMYPHIIPTEVLGDLDQEEKRQ
ncbi:hypothetical protein FPHYL_6984 [Fusarium phyllophilum]|uniref:Uncharacterized protein n=1 Tax=Fusarium phyllophilum TaxID=47803 RepID=A0A8H5NBB2_9HYPO|nr:hypothetical protein FPHYL_6984 [Fusarium phyllophilum]